MGQWINFIMNERDASLDDAPPFTRAAQGGGAVTPTLEDEMDDELAEAERV
jgi:hypothetical protein